MKKVNVFSKKLGSTVAVEVSKVQTSQNWEAWVNAGWGNGAPVK